jgi:predicted glycoside hydrolase/deacetylase ChbG (UPF0249 family)
VHADDCGLSAGITDAIMACCDLGCVRRTSVVVNSSGWSHAVAALRQRPALPVVLHLNLFEGDPVSPPAEVDLLVNRAGRFRWSFVSLWARSAFGIADARLKAQVRLELRRQIERFLEAFDDRGPLSVDGHVHYHVLPLVLHELLELATDYRVAAIRLPRDPLYWPTTRSAPRPPLANVTKNLVLRYLCDRAKPTLDAHSIRTPAAFVGVLGSGTMSLAHVRAAFERLRQTDVEGEVEILVHPGRARPDEAWIWRDRPELQAFYLSEARDREAEVVCSPLLSEILRTYEAPGCVHAPTAPTGEVAP